MKASTEPLWFKVSLDMMYFSTATGSHKMSVESIQMSSHCMKNVHIFRIYCIYFVI